MYYSEGNNPVGSAAAFQQTVSQMNGVIYGSSHTSIGAITDGTSNTFLFIETTYGIKDPTYGGNKWWIQGHPGQTLAGSYYPVNVGKKIPFNVDNNSARGIASAAAGSYHPGGANIAFCDGSVHFIKETIATWPMDPATGNPTWLTFTNAYSGIYPYQNNFFTLVVPAGQSMPVFQALSSRNGGEVISADQY
jgi:prepilin-type processing-associated H-X9-DG protein